jgi:hypothetical protein
MQVAWIHCISFFVFVPYSIVECVGTCRYGRHCASGICSCSYMTGTHSYDCECSYEQRCKDGRKCPSGRICSCSNMKGTNSYECECCDDSNGLPNCSSSEVNVLYIWIPCTLVGVWLLCRVLNAIYKTKMVRAAEILRDTAMHQKEIVIVTLVNKTPDIVQVA